MTSSSGKIQKVTPYVNSYRVVPFISTTDGTQMYTLIQEWHKNGKCVKDLRQHMNLATFESLLKSVTDAATETDLTSLKETENATL